LKRDKGGILLGKKGEIQKKGGKSLGKEGGGEPFSIQKNKTQ